MHFKKQHCLVFLAPQHLETLKNGEISKCLFNIHKLNLKIAFCNDIVIMGAQPLVGKCQENYLIRSKLLWQQAFYHHEMHLPQPFPFSLVIHSSTHSWLLPVLFSCLLFIPTCSLVFFTHFVSRTYSYLPVLFSCLLFSTIRMSSLLLSSLRISALMFSSLLVSSFFFYSRIFCLPFSAFLFASRIVSPASRHVSSRPF